jgi:site-specific DNA-methyltransferase (adenine-specific)
MLINGDCIEEMKKLSDKSVDLLICDLPFSETHCEWDTKINLGEFWIEFKRIRKSNRVACIHFCSTRFGYDLIKSWLTGGMNSKYRPLRGHQMLYFFYEKTPKYNRDKYHTRINNVKMGASTTLNEIKNTSNKMNYTKSNFEPTNPSSVLFIGKRFHQTEKPQDILEFIIKYWSDEGDIILDPTMGSGSTGVACHALERKFIGIEKNKNIYSVADERINGDK